LREEDVKHPESIARLIHKFSLLPGVGQKTAARYAYFIIEGSRDKAADFASAILEVKDKVRLCSVCFCFSEGETCGICAARDASVICVVAYPKDIAVIEKAGFRGAYHCLGGTLSPLDGRGPEEIRLKELLKRVNAGGVTEVIMATNPDVEGEATAL